MFSGGKITCDASKKSAQQHQKLYENAIPLNKGFGQRIDLLLKTRGIETAANEFKKRNASKELCLAQQTKNMCLNKAILSYLLEMPVAAVIFFVLAMDWIGKLTLNFFDSSVLLKLLFFDKKNRTVILYLCHAESRRHLSMAS